MIDRHAIFKASVVATLLSVIAACSAKDPVPSPLHDGNYAGIRQSDRTDACGISELRGKARARVAEGRLTMPLFSAKTPLVGTVGDDGTIRASGIWPNPTGGFPGVTVLNGTIKDNVMDGTASDLRCHTDLHLHKVTPPSAGSDVHGNARKP